MVISLTVIILMPWWLASRRCSHEPAYSKQVRFWRGQEHTGVRRKDFRFKRLAVPLTIHNFSRMPGSDIPVLSG